MTWLCPKVPKYYPNTIIMEGEFWHDFWGGHKLYSIAGAHSDPKIFLKYNFYPFLSPHLKNWASKFFLIYRPQQLISWNFQYQGSVLTRAKGTFPAKIWLRRDFALGFWENVLRHLSHVDWGSLTHMASNCLIFRALRGSSCFVCLLGSEPPPPTPVTMDSWFWKAWEEAWFSYWPTFSLLGNKNPLLVHPYEPASSPFSARPATG